MPPTLAEKEALIGLFRAGRYAEACAAARAMARRHPRSLDAWNIRGASARELGQLQEAEKCFCELERLAPTFAGAPYNLGLVLENKRADVEAAQAYTRALSIDPDMAQAHNNVGSVYLRLGKVERAYTHLKHAASLQPGWPEVQNSLGNVLKRLNRVDEARAAYQAATGAGPHFTNAHYNLGVLESENGRGREAIAAFQGVLGQQPDHALARTMLLGELANACEWDAMAEHGDFIPKLGTETQAVPPFLMLALEDNPGHQLERSRKWAKARFGHIAEVALRSNKQHAQPRSRPERLRVGYFGADFHDHPGMRLMAGMLREHDRSRFEIHAISYGRLDEDEWRATSQAVVDVFHDVYGWADADALNLAHGLGLDIAIDRKGYTTDTRSDWFAQRIAPVQINYLGYPSTMAAPFIDYMVADRTVIPERHRGHYAEKMIWLPECYQPGNNTLKIASACGTRSDHNLPENAVVLCCFNNLYKLNARVFAIWMRVLSAVEKSVLWLFSSNETAKANVRLAARKAGVDPARLIFAPRVPNAEHLARHVHADLSLDTAPCNAHTTCNDALWAGLPMVTRVGDQFASRVAASLLEAIGLSDLITSTDEAYEALILELATNDAKRRAIRDKLAVQRESAPLFDTARYTRHLEAGFEAAYDRCSRGLPPADIEVEPYPGQKG